MLLTFADAKVLHEIREFASPNEIETIIKSCHTMSPKSGGVRKKVPVHADAIFPPELVARVSELIDPASPRSVTATATAGLVKTMSMTTEPHVDAYTESGDAVVDEFVSFIFLNTNPDAEFVHGDQSVPVEAGKLVTFPGDEAHNTVIRRGLVQIAGPFASSSGKPVTGDPKKKRTDEHDSDRERRRLRE